VPLAAPVTGPSEARRAALDAALPQTQCTRCGYPDCARYAAAIDAAAASIDRCPPGGADGIRRLAAITGHPVTPLDPTHGLEAPRQRAFIDEAWCIGCTLCIDACPVDAIVGAPKRMHTVLEAECTGCALCLPVCPVDCIALVGASADRTGWAAWSQAQADTARARYGVHRLRIERCAGEERERLASARGTPAPNAGTLPLEDPAGPTLAKPSAALEAALARARVRRPPLA
jgi:Na+-translocating ferredoxin:NAD+ oxidoreductase subunit B